MSMLAGSTSDPLMADFVPSRLDPVRDWGVVSWVAASRAQQLVDDFPVAAGMIRARLLGTHGSDGVRFRSLFRKDEDLDTDEYEERMRVEIDAFIAKAETQVDASRVMSRREFEWHLDWIAIIYGDAFAVRVKQKGRPNGRDPFVTRWRIVHPWRVRSPQSAYELVNGKRRWIDGGKFDDQGRLVSIGIVPDESLSFASATLGTGTVQEIPIDAPDGTPNVIHRRMSVSRIGHWRGLTAFAPIILDSRLLQGLGVAYVAAKRTQASHPMMIKVQDVTRARELYQGTKIANLLIGEDEEVQFSNYKFEGADYAAFYDTQLRNLCSPWGIPYELALGDHSAKSGASGRSIWQAYYLTSAQNQRDFIDQVIQPMDYAYFREGVLRGMLPDLPMDRLMIGKYVRPQRITPDPLKEAQAAHLWNQLGVSKTTLFEQVGWEFTDEQRQRHQERVIEEEQGLLSEEQSAHTTMPQMRVSEHA